MVSTTGVCAFHYVPYIVIVADFVTHGTCVILCTEGSTSLLTVNPSVRVMGRTMLLFTPGIKIFKYLIRKHCVTAVIF